MQPAGSQRLDRHNQRRRNYAVITHIISTLMMSDKQKGNHRHPQRRRKAKASSAAAPVVAKNDTSKKQKNPPSLTGVTHLMLSVEDYKRLSGMFEISGDENGCWEWKGALNGSGRGRFQAQGIKDYAYRFILFIILGFRFKVGDVVDHTCNNPSCVRPGHLNVTDHAGNMRAMAERGRGDKKLTREQRNEIRRLGNAPDRPSQRILARKYGVSQSHISRIQKGKS